MSHRRGLADRTPARHPPVGVGPEAWLYFKDGLLQAEQRPARHINTFVYDRDGDMKRSVDRAGPERPDEAALVVESS